MSSLRVELEPLVGELDRLDRDLVLRGVGLSGSSFSTTISVGGPLSGDLPGEKRGDRGRAGSIQRLSRGNIDASMLIITLVIRDEEHCDELLAKLGEQGYAAERLRERRLLGGRSDARRFRRGCFATPEERNDAISEPWRVAA